MKNFSIIVFSFCVIFANTFAADSILQTRLMNAQKGDYIVTESNQMISLLAIRSLTPQSLILEEISAPANALQNRPASWSAWVRDRAPGNTSWSMVEIDLENHQILECYSFSRSAWVQISSQGSIISTLLGLNLQPVAASEQRRIGPPPPNGEADLRKIWKPPLIEDGEHHHNASFDVYRADWPKDDSDFAGNTVSLYFDHDNRCPFPVWVQVDTAHVSASLRMIDFGKDLPVIHRNLPRRVPEFVGLPQKFPTGLRLTLKSPRYYRSFELFAIDVTTHEKQICPITHSLIQGDGETVQIEIDQDDLIDILEPDHRYTWLIVPAGHNEYYSESHKSFLWKPDSGSEKNAYLGLP